MKLVAYCRVSTEEQQKQGLSLPAQEERIRLFAQALGHEVVEVIVETSSAKIPFIKRLGGARALQRIKLGRAEGVAVVRLDRLTRTLKDLLEIVEHAQLYDWAVVSATETLDTTTPSGRLVVSVLGMVNQFERETTVERTKDALAELRRQGKRFSYRPPYGYDDRNGQLIVNKLEQTVISTAITARNLGHSWARIAWALGSDGSRTGRPWHEDVLRRAITRAQKNGFATAA